ncbi:MAG: hypothetical protein IPI55_18980 [Flavobacteriales bacterium]|nr:hypothetical protein [Flavobacteriales bacterium]
MRYTLCIGLAHIMSVSALAQASANDTILKDLHGMLDTKGHTYIQGNGYVIKVEYHDWPASQSAYAKTKKKQQPSVVLLAQDDPELPVPNAIFEERPDSGNQVQTTYCIPDRSKGYWYIAFATVRPEERAFERSLVLSIHANSGYKGMMTAREAQEIDFCGRKIPLGPACHWMGPYNCQCSGLGQMNWSITNDRARASRLIDAQLDATKLKNKILQRDSVAVVFEGAEAKALRVVYKMPKVVKFLGQTSDHLVAYYVVAPVRDRYVTCVLSHYGDPAADRSLPPLLSEVMVLKE